ncbi:UNVERIFIED_CONTAM: hypothetical protein Sindi_1814300, partial [Sesamum indicum]
RVTLNQGSDKLILQALPYKAGTKALSTHSLAQLMRRKNPKVQGVLLMSYRTPQGEIESTKVLELLQLYDDVFQDPHSLPHERSIVHCIELHPEAIPKKQHPY